MCQARRGRARKRLSRPSASAARMSGSAAVSQTAQRGSGFFLPGRRGAVTSVPEGRFFLARHTISSTSADRSGMSQAQARTAVNPLFPASSRQAARPPMGPWSPSSQTVFPAFSAAARQGASGLREMTVSGHTERTARRARARKVSCPMRRPALSRPMRLERPPARTAPRISLLFPFMA